MNLIFFMMLSCVFATSPIATKRPPAESACRKNEHFEECGTACPPTCNNPNPQICILQCVRGCFCDKGLLRDEKSGKCVPPKECPPRKCRDDEEYKECGSACPETCDNRNNTCLACIALCVEGCFCKDGLVRAANGTCIPPKQCPQPVCTGQNEHFDWCPPNCPHQNCSAIWSRIDCTNASDCCKPQCRCIDGYYRNDSGICISVNECIHGSNCGPNSRFNDCGSACPLTCEEPEPRPCTRQCVAGCVCEDGFVKDKDGNCIKPNECPSPICPENEEWNSCGTACPKTCKNKDLEFGCIAVCKEGCFCKDGLVRNDKGVCVNPKECPPTCKANEVYSNCSIVCPPQTCASVYTTYLCDKNATCKPGCNCVDGYLRNGTANDPCIPSDKCPPPSPVCPENEEWNSCGTACPKTCKNKDLEINCIAVCKEGCFCKDGLVRNDKGVCVDPKQCCNETSPSERRRLIG